MFPSQKSIKSNRIKFIVEEGVKNKIIEDLKSSLSIQGVNFLFNKGDPIRHAEYNPKLPLEEEL